MNEHTNKFISDETNIRKVESYFKNKETIQKLIVNTSLGRVNLTGTEGRSWYTHSAKNSGLDYHKANWFGKSEENNKVAKQKLGVVLKSFLPQQNNKNWMYIIVLRGYDKVEGKKIRTYYINVFDYKSGNQQNIYEPHFLISFASDNNNQGISADTLYQAMYASSPSYEGDDTKKTQKARLSYSRGFFKTRSKTKQRQIQAFKTYESVNNILNELSKLGMVHVNPYKFIDPEEKKEKNSELLVSSPLGLMNDIRRRTTNVDDIINRSDNEYYQKNSK